jgi:hypothetical protein
VHVPLIRRGTVEGDRPKWAVPGLFEDRGAIPVPKPEAAPRPTNARGEQTCLARLILKFHAELIRNAVRVSSNQSSLGGNHDVSDELTDVRCHVGCLISHTDISASLARHRNLLICTGRLRHRNIELP